MDKTLTTGMVDLGRERTRMEYAAIDTPKPTEKKYTEYPHFCVRGKDDLLKLPQEEFYAVVKLKMSEFSKRKDWENPENTIAEVEFDILAIKPLDVPATKKVMSVEKIDFSSLRAEPEEADEMEEEED